MTCESNETKLPENLARPAKRALAGAGIDNFDQLARMTEDEVLGLHGMGPKAMGQLRSALSEGGRSFAKEER